MRRAIPLLAALITLCAASSAAAHSRVRAGTIPVATSRVRVIVTLPRPPLALRGTRGLALAVARRKLDTSSASAHGYMRELEAAQARASRKLRAAIPQARVGRAFQVVLDGLTVSLPAAKLPALLRQRWIAKVYPSLQYTLADDTSPAVIGADALHAASGASGAGIKIGIVDDGVDETNPFFSPAGFSYPAGFPKGDVAATTAKVIVARTFPGPNSGKAGRLPVDPESSFHGTHVAGIAAGDSGTTAPAGADHPRVTGLSGVAPRAWLGNYRVFTVPTPVGHVANTPEIVAAFEAAVKDGMDIVNFSGGGPEVEPSNDALIAAVHAVAAAGVVPVIAAGNDRDDFGDGSVGSPGTAPDAISVAAVSNTHVFGARLTAPSDAAISIPFVGADRAQPPTAWGTANQTLVDVGAIPGVERHLCGGPLPAGSLRHALALVDRGLCPFVDKAARARAAGAIGIVFVDNRQGEANVAPTRLPIPGGTIANVDGARLRSLASAHGGRIAVRIESGPFEIETGRSGVVTSFSSSGPTPFEHDLKPDVAAPGGQILSSTLPNTDPSRFAVFDGTSMATPHVAGAAALLLQLHRSWTPAEVKSALMSTAQPAYGDTARTREAAVPLEGAGLAAVERADDPAVFTEPASLSFGDVTPGAPKTLLVRVDDAGGGAGTWNVAVEPQATTAGATLEVAPLAVVPPGGSTTISVTATAGGGTTGENDGFLVLEQGRLTRRIPYLFLLDDPQLQNETAVPLRGTQRGDTRNGTDRVERYRYPTAPFGNQPDQPPMTENGHETVYSTTLPPRVVNAGVVVVDRSSGARIDPWYLRRQDESTVQGFAGTPVDVNELTFDYQVDIGAAGVSYPAAGTYVVAVDSSRAGSYVLHSWVNDVTPPTLQLLTTQVTAGRPTLVFRTTDAGAGVDPLSLTIGYGGSLVSVGTFRRSSGLAIFPLPRSVEALRAGVTRLQMMSSDYQEAKNVDTMGASILPNTRTRTASLRVVAGTTVDWLLPLAHTCSTRTQLEVTAGSTARVRSVRFSVDGHSVAARRSGTQGLWSASVRIARGRHVLVAAAADAGGRTASARRIVGVCNG